MPEPVATDAESTEALVASLGWDTTPEEKSMLDEIDDQRDLMDVDVTNDDTNSDDEKEPIPSPADAAPVLPDADATPAETPADVIAKALEAETPKESELEAYKRIEAETKAIADRDTQVAGQIAQMAKDYRDDLVTKGWKPEQANELAKQAGENAWSKYELHKITESSAADKLSSLDESLGKQYGVDPKLIANFNNAEGKEAFAKTMGAMKTTTDQAAKVAAVPKAPASHQDSGEGTPGAANNKAQQKQDYASGKTNLTRSAFNDLFGYWP